MVEAFGVLPRAKVAEEVKALDQDARGALRKHGIRFGQFTIFMPLLLKPAPTRLRLVLWALSSGLQEFPEAPPPGLVTVPVAKDAPQGYDTMCGYRDAGERSIRIDMLERLADMLRQQDSRSGFEATADMLSITGMTLEQFADLMQGLGYQAERGERAKQKPQAAAEQAADTPAEPVQPAAEATANAPEAPAESVEEAVAEAAEAPAEALADPAAEAAPQAGADAAAQDGGAQPASAEAETEVFFTFRWGRKPAGQGRGPRRGGEARGQAGKPQGRGDDNRREGGKPGGPRRDGAKGGKPRREGGKPGKPQGDHGKTKSFEARPPRKEKQIDPDNPFAAALMGLKQKG